MSLSVNLAKPVTMVAGTDADALDVNTDIDYLVSNLNATNIAVNNEELARIAQDALKAPLDSPFFTGVPRSANPPLGTNTNQFATCAFVAGTAVVATIPTTGGDNGKVMTAVAGAPSWQALDTFSLAQLQATALSF